MRSGVFVTLLCGIVFLIACKEKKKYHDDAVSKYASKSQVNSLQEILDFQEEKNAEFRNPETSPLPDRFRKDFEGLDFFAPDTAYVIRAKFIRTPDAIPFMMSTTTNRKTEEVVYGIAKFMLHGKERTLEVYQNKELMLDEGFEDYLFLPFSDLTNDEETYGGGRYIDLRIPEADEITIDFNRAYNPSCVYNKKYSCPLVPAVNQIDTRILAGVKAFKKD